MNNVKSCNQFATQLMMFHDIYSKLTIREQNRNQTLKHGRKRKKNKGFSRTALSHEDNVSRCDSLSLLNYVSIHSVYSKLRYIAVVPFMLTL